MSDPTRRLSHVVLPAPPAFVTHPVRVLTFAPGLDVSFDGPLAERVGEPQTAEAERLMRAAVAAFIRHSGEAEERRLFAAVEAINCLDGTSARRGTGR